MRARCSGGVDAGVAGVAPRCALRTWLMRHSPLTLGLNLGARLLEGTNAPRLTCKYVHGEVGGNVTSFAGGPSQTHTEPYSPAHQE